jgi:predicted alpha/beta hydrolase family esterase
MVLEFMQENIPASRLIGVAESLPQMARLLWAITPQEPIQALLLVLPKTPHPSQSNAIEFSPVPECVDDDSVVAVVSQ